MIKFQIGGIATQDNTRVARKQPLIFKLTKEQQNRIKQKKLQEAAKRNQAVIYDADKAKYYQNMQNFYNNNFWGYGVGGRQTNYDPRTPQGQAAIQANFDYAKSNVQNFATTLLTTRAGEGAAQAIRWATTPTKIEQGAEAVAHHYQLG